LKSEAARSDWETTRRAEISNDVEAIRNSSPPYSLSIVSGIQTSVLKLFRLKRDVVAECFKFSNAYLSRGIIDRNSSWGFFGPLLRKFSSSNQSELIAYVKTEEALAEMKADMIFVAYCLLSSCDMSMCEELLNILLSVCRLVMTSLYFI
jgi:hypothetical protein